MRGHSIWVTVRNRLISLFLDSESNNNNFVIIQADNCLQQNPTLQSQASTASPPHCTIYPLRLETVPISTRQESMRQMWVLCFGEKLMRCSRIGCVCRMGIMDGVVVCFVFFVIKRCCDGELY